MLLTEKEMNEIPREQFELVAQTWLTEKREVVSAKTTGRRLTSLRCFARWAGWGPMLSDYSAPTPFRGDPHPLPEGMDGIRRMLKLARTEQQRALIALCGMAGLRISETLKVRPSDFDLIEMSLVVHGKGNKLRKVPITEEAWTYICSAVARAFVDGDRPILEFKDRFARAIVTNLAKRAGLMRRVASHDLRATFATALYDRTQDQRLVQEILGHAHGSTTEVYILASMDRARKAMAEL